MASDIKPANRGKLHKQLGVKPGQKIPSTKLHKAMAEAKKHHNSHMEKEIQYALNNRG